MEVDAIQSKKATVRPLSGDELLESFPGIRIPVNPGYPEIYDTEFFESFYRWYHTHPLADQIYRWAAFTPEGEAVGHLAAMPQAYRINGQRVIAHTPGDYMVLPGYGFQALSLMRSFFRATENCVTCDMAPAVISVQSRLGAELAGEMRYAAKLLDVSRLPLPSLPAPLRRLLGREEPEEAQEQSQQPAEGDLTAEAMVAPPTRPRAPIPAPAKAVLNRGLAAVDDLLARNYGRGVEVEEIHSFDASFDDFFEKVAAIIPCIPEKDSAFLNWRYGPGCLQHPVKVLGVRGAQGLLGYAVLKQQTSPTYDGYIMDLTVLPGYREVARALLRETVRYFRSQGTDIIRYRFVDSPTSPRSDSLRRMGFYYREGRSNSLMVKFSDPEAHESARHLTNWSYTTGDGEATFMLR